MNRMSRRKFLVGAGAGAAALLGPTDRVLGANNDIRVAVVGTGGKGTQHAKLFNGLRGVRVVAVCDVDPRHAASAASILNKRGGKVRTYTDARKLIDDGQIDAMVIATCNHWHALLTVWACQAGIDVYVEKPVSHNIFEGRQMVAAAAKYKRIVQAGTQSRSCTALTRAVPYVRSGALGKIKWIHSFWYKLRGSIGKVAPWTPKDLDYDLFCGPAPVRPLERKNLHYDWHWMWDTGNGDMGNLGVHELDVSRWFAGYTTLPPHAMAVGGRFAVNDAGDTPNTILGVYDYTPAPIFWETRNLPRAAGSRTMDSYYSSRNTVLVMCEGGYFSGRRGGGIACDKAGKRIKEFKGDAGGGHPANFIKAVRSRKTSDLAAPITEGHASTSICHTGNISYRLGTPATPKQAIEAIGVHAEAAETVTRFTKHLAANTVDLAKTPLTLGPWITLDTAAETVTAAAACARANALLTRPYRKGFVVPKNV